MLARLRHASAIAAVALAFLMPTVSQAATVVTWDTFASTDGTTTYKFSYFDNGTKNFPGITASTLNIAGTGFLHDHGKHRTFSIAILLDGVWTELYNSGPTFGRLHYLYLSSLSPFEFPEGEVTALSFSVNAQTNQAYNAMLGTQFTFDLVTPLPAALPLFGSGLGLIVLLSRLRRRKDARAA